MVFDDGICETLVDGYILFIGRRLVKEFCFGGDWDGQRIQTGRQVCCFGSISALKRSPNLSVLVPRFRQPFAQFIGHAIDCVFETAIAMGVLFNVPSLFKKMEGVVIVVGRVVTLLMTTSLAVGKSRKMIR
jgi:hypothetical protein